MTEKWAEITGYANRYRISTEGVVQQHRWNRWVTLSRQVTPRRTEGLLRGLDGKQKHLGVFRLLDRTFCGGYAEKHGLCVGPKNGVRQDCTLQNLAYRTQAEIGRESTSRHMKKPVIVYDRLGQAEIYHSLKEAALKTGLSRAAVGRRIHKGVMDAKGRHFELAN